MFGSFGNVFGDWGWDDLVVGDENDVAASETVSFKEKLGGILIVDDNIEESATSYGFQRLDEAVVIDGEKLEDTSFDLLSVKVWLRITILEIREGIKVYIESESGIVDGHFVELLVKVVHGRDCLAFFFDEVLVFFVCDVEFYGNYMI